MSTPEAACPVPQRRFRSRWLRLSLVAGAAALSLLAVACDPPTPTPATPTFTSAIDPSPAYEPMATPCDPENSFDKPGPLALRDLLNATYGVITSGDSRPCDGTVSEHNDGRALDWMADYRNPTQQKYALAVIDWLRATDAFGHKNAIATRLGLQYWIYNKQIYGSWNGFNPAPYSCGNGTDPTACHVNHIHFSFTYAGSMKLTSFWRGGNPLPTVTSTTFTVDSRSAGPTVPPVLLAAGRTYTFEVSGTYRYGGSASQIADAECSQNGSGWSPNSRYSTIFGGSHLDLRITVGSAGGTTWTPVTDTGGGCNSADHRYRMTIRPTQSNVLAAVVLDQGRSDNSGPLTVHVTS